VRALDGLDLTVPTGQVVGFLGPNGSGKSTTIRVLLGLLRADSGRVRVLDGDPWADAVALHRRLAYVPGDVNLWPNLTGGEAIDLLEAFELDPTKRARTYSKGNRQKVALVAALAADVELLVLDEPTSGLDPLMEEVFREQIDRARAIGRSVLLSSHILGEVEKLCDRVTIIRNGRTVEAGTLAELRHLTRTSMTAVTDLDPAPLARLVGVHDLTVVGGKVSFLVDNTHLDVVVRELAGLGVRSLVTAPPSLEELFLRHYGDEPAPVGADAP